MPHDRCDNLPDADEILMEGMTKGQPAGQRI